MIRSSPAWPSRSSSLPNALTEKWAGRFQEHLEDGRPAAPDERISAPFTLHTIVLHHLVLTRRGPEGDSAGDRTAPAALWGDRGRGKIIGFVALRLRRDLELFAQLGIEVTPILLISERVMPTGGEPRAYPTQQERRAGVRLHRGEAENLQIR